MGRRHRFCLWIGQATPLQRGKVGFVALPLPCLARRLSGCGEGAKELGCERGLLADGVLAWAGGGARLDLRCLLQSRFRVVSCDERVIFD